jgi:hypothetical protein
LENRAEQVLPGSKEGQGKEGESRGQEGEMSQTMYAHMNKFFKKRLRLKLA